MGICKCLLCTFIKGNNDNTKIKYLEFSSSGGSKEVDNDEEENNIDHDFV